MFWKTNQRPEPTPSSGLSDEAKGARIKDAMRGIFTAMKQAGILDDDELVTHALGMSVATFALGVASMKNNADMIPAVVEAVHQAAIDAIKRGPSTTR
jgi:hypothetical protein